MPEPKVAILTTTKKDFEYLSNRFKIKGDFHKIDQKRDLSSLDFILIDARYGLPGWISQRLRDIKIPTIVLADSITTVPGKNNIFVSYINTRTRSIKREIVRLKKVKELHEGLQKKILSASRSTKLMNFFKNLNGLIANAEDIDGLIKGMMRHVKDFFQFRHYIVFVRDEDSNILVPRISSRKRKSLKKEGRFNPGDGIAGWVLAKQRPVIITETEQDRRFQAEAFLHKDFKSKQIFCFPLGSPKSLSIVVELINAKSPKEINQSEMLDLLSEITPQMNLAIEKVLFQQRLQEMVLTDDLTNLFNTRYLNRTLEVEIERAERYSSSMSLIFMDIDHFKEINDSYGHLIGSKLLVEVAQLLLRKLRSIDIVVRYGGDEFVIILPMTTSKCALKVAERLRRTLAEEPFLRQEGLNIRITASFGVATYPEDAHTKEDLLRLADEAMYKVKYQSRNGVYAISQHLKTI